MPDDIPLPTLGNPLAERGSRMVLAPKLEPHGPSRETKSPRADRDQKGPPPKRRRLMHLPEPSAKRGANRTPRRLYIFQVQHDDHMKDRALLPPHGARQSPAAARRATDEVDRLVAGFVDEEVRYAKLRPNDRYQALVFMGHGWARGGTK